MAFPLMNLEKTITVNKVLKDTKEKGVSWPLNPNQTDDVIAQLRFPKRTVCMPNRIKGCLIIITSVRGFSIME